MNSRRPSVPEFDKVLQTKNGRPLSLGQTMNANFFRICCCDNVSSRRDIRRDRLFEQDRQAGLDCHQRGWSVLMIGQRHHGRRPSTASEKLPEGMHQPRDFEYRSDLPRLLGVWGPWHNHRYAGLFAGQQSREVASANGSSAAGNPPRLPESIHWVAAREWRAATGAGAPAVCAGQINSCRRYPPCPACLGREPVSM